MPPIRSSSPQTPALRQSPSRLSSSSPGAKALHGKGKNGRRSPRSATKVCSPPICLNNTNKSYSNKKKNGKNGKKDAIMESNSEEVENEESSDESSVIMMETILPVAAKRVTRKSLQQQQEQKKQQQQPKAIAAVPSAISAAAALTPTIVLSSSAAAANATETANNEGFAADSERNDNNSTVDVEAGETKGGSAGVPERVTRKQFHRVQASLKAQRRRMLQEYLISHRDLTLQTYQHPTPSQKQPPSQQLTTITETIQHNHQHHETILPLLQQQQQQQQQHQKHQKQTKRPRGRPPLSATKQSTTSPQHKLTQQLDSSTPTTESRNHDNLPGPIATSTAASPQQTKPATNALRIYASSFIKHDIRCFPALQTSRAGPIPWKDELQSFASSDDDDDGASDSEMSMEHDDQHREQQHQAGYSSASYSKNGLKQSTTLRRKNGKVSTSPKLTTPKKTKKRQKTSTPTTPTKNTTPTGELSPNKQNNNSNNKNGCLKDNSDNRATLKKTDFFVRIWRDRGGDSADDSAEDGDDDDDDDGIAEADHAQGPGGGGFKKLAEGFPSLPLLPRERPLPHHNAYVPISNNYRVRDEPVLKFVPYFDGEQTATQDLLNNDHFDITERERRFQYGPDYQQQHVNELLDTVLDAVFDELKTINIVMTKSIGERICTVLAQLSHEPRVRVDERYKFVRTRQRATQLSEQIAKDQAEVIDLQDGDDGGGSSSSDDEFPVVPKDAEEKAYYNAQDSYRILYCRRCFTYDCNVHGIHKKRSIGLQYRLAKVKELEKVWSKFAVAAPSGGPLFCLPVKNGKNHTLEKEKNDNGKASFEGAITELTDFHKTICKRMFLIFDGDIHQMSIAMRAPQTLLTTYVKEQNFKVPEAPKIDRVTCDKSKYYSLKWYNQKWYQATKADIHPFFDPCSHEDSVCNEKNCTCIQNHFFCSKACLWARQSRNFFRGCNCKQNCTSMSCTCFANGRECDPDLCACDTCTDSPNKPAAHQRCRNDNMTMHRRHHLMIAESSVTGSGWGAFNKYPIKKNDYVSEYLGEMISQSEAERRGIINDERRCSYLFNLSSDRVVDGYRKGNKTRFMNHSNDPNCAPRLMFVNGDHRVGMFALRDIDAQSELFFDYRYNQSMENHLISKPAQMYHWMIQQQQPAAAAAAALNNKSTTNTAAATTTPKQQPQQQPN